MNVLYNYFRLLTAFIFAFKFYFFPLLKQERKENGMFGMPFAINIYLRYDTRYWHWIKLKE